MNKDFDNKKFTDSFDKHKKFLKESLTTHNEIGASYGEPVSMGEEKEGICHACNGSGEGMADRTVCKVCKGSGTTKPRGKMTKRTDPDYDWDSEKNEQTLTEKHQNKDFWRVVDYATKFLNFNTRSTKNGILVCPPNKQIPCRPCHPEDKGVYDLIRYIAKIVGVSKEELERAIRTNTQIIRSQTPLSQIVVKEGVLDSNEPYYVEYVKEMPNEEPFMMGGQKYQYVMAKYPNGKVDIGVYKFGEDMVIAYDAFRKQHNIKEVSDDQVIKSQKVDNDSINKPYRFIYYGAGSGNVYGISNAPTIQDAIKEFLKTTVRTDAGDASDAEYDKAKVEYKNGYAVVDYPQSLEGTFVAVDIQSDNPDVKLEIKSLGLIKYADEYLSKRGKNHMGLDESTPPNFPDDLEKKIIKQYGKSPKAYATMWALHKKHGDKLQEMWIGMKENHDPDERERHAWMNKINRHNRRNPARFPCPTCGTKDALSAYEQQKGYQCNRCADAEEGNF